MSNTVASAKSIFLEALEIPTQLERQAYLDAHCGDDPNLRREVADLLRCHAGVGSFLDSPPTAIAQSADVLRESAKTPPSLSFLQPSTRAGSLGRLGSYEIEEVIGSGGMGIVLRALDDKLHRAVAIKVMAPALATNEHARRRFVREGRAAAAVRDDHVIGIHGVDEASGLPFLVMEYVVGRSLAQRLEAEGPLPLADILRIGGQIARGLAAAHSQGVVHRDIKPANILLENGIERVKITDFGLAHAVDDVRTTQPGTVVGTPEYMSPEQARGERVDHRSDLFSLGCVLYAMCAGRPPFRAESTVAIIRRVCEDTPRPLSEINADTPSWLAAIIDRLIAKAPDERFQSATEVAELLEQCLQQVQAWGAGNCKVQIDKCKVQIENRRPKTTAANSKFAIRNSKFAIGWPVAAAIMLLVVSLIASETAGVTNLAATVIRIVRGDGTLVVEVDDPNIQVLVDGEELVINGAGPKEIRLRPGQHELQSVKDGKAVDTKLVTISREGREVIKVTREVPPGPIATSPSSRLVWADINGDANADDSSSALSPDGRLIAFVDWGTGDLAIRDLTTGKNRSLTNKTSWSSGEFADRPVFSPDGRQLAYSWYDKDGQPDLHIMNVEGGEPRVVYGNKKDKVQPAPCGWTQDGKTILAMLQFSVESADATKTVPSRSRRIQLALIATADGSTRIIETYNYRPSAGDTRRRYLLAPDGRTIAYHRPTSTGSAIRDIFLIDVETGKEMQLSSHKADKTLLAWTPDGQGLLFDMEQQGGRDGWLIRIAEGKPSGEATLVKKDLGVVEPLGMTREGALFYCASFRGPNIFTVTLDWEKGAGAASPLAAEKFDTVNAFALGDWSPDGEQLAYWAYLQKERTRELRILSMKSGETRVLKSNLQAPMLNLRWSPDGRSFVVSDRRRGNESAVHQVDAESGRATVIVEPNGNLPGTNRAAWSRDGRGFFYLKRPETADETTSIVYRDLQTQTERAVVPSGNPLFSGDRVVSFEPSPDGRQLALLGRPNEESLVLWLVPTEGGSPSELFRVNAQETYAGGVAWTPDGTSLLFVQRGGNEAQRGLWHISATGGPPRKFEIPFVRFLYDTQIRMHPDGKQLAVGEEGGKKTDLWALENFLPPLNTDHSSEKKQANAAKKP